MENGQGDKMNIDEFLDEFVSNAYEEMFPQPENSIDNLSDDVIDTLLQDLSGEENFASVPSNIVEEILNDNIQQIVPQRDVDLNHPSTSGQVQSGGSVGPLTLIKQTKSTNTFFGMESYTDEFRINPVPDDITPMTWLERAFRELFTRMNQNITPDTSRVIFKFNGEGMTKPAYYNVTHNFSCDDLWEHVSTVCQSTRAYDAVNDSFTLEYSVMRTMRGACATGEDFFTHRHKSTFIIDNDDNLCFPRSLVVALYRAKENRKRDKDRTADERKEWVAIRDARRDPQRNCAVELSIAAGVEVPAEGCGRDEIIKYQDYLAHAENAAIVVYEYRKDSKNPTIFYNGIKRVEELQHELKYVLYIVFYTDFHHYEPIQCIHRFINTKYGMWCTLCQCGFKKEKGHSCPGECSMCFKTPPCKIELLKKCWDCRRSFANNGCFERHKEDASYYGSQSVCSAKKICQVCGSLLTKGKTHHCGMNWCSICGEYRKPGHGCFMKKIKMYVKKDRTVRRRKCEAFVCYDFETRQDEQLVENGITMNLHIPNYYVAQITCEECANLPYDDDICEMDKRQTPLVSVSPCYVCPKREYKYHGDDAVKNFLGVIENLKKFHSKVICIAHNAKGYDGQFLLRSVMELRISGVETILTGSNIMLMSYDNVKFIDSFNYIQMALCAFPKTFGLTGISKGYFPHFFNRQENQNYVGPMPPKETFGIRALHERDNTEFEEWYDRKVNENYIFNFKLELERYCVQDVVILRRSAMLFRSFIMKIGKICPFSRCVTIASTCMQIFQVNYLKQDQIGIIPRNGYRLAETQSRVAVGWLMWLEKSENIQIQHAGRGREYVLGKIKLDGYRVDNNGQKFAYQFQGCYWHGCLKCFPTNRETLRRDGTSLDDRYSNTQTRNMEIQSHNVTLIEMWECEFNKEKKSNKLMREYVNSMDVQVFIPLNPRDAFFGGRTGNTVTVCEVQPGEQIHYDDVCSLYPYVLKTGSFPVGHPEVYLWDRIDQICPNNNISNIEGLIKCRVLAPQNLFHAVLPVRAHDKLFFPLCRTCLENQIETECPHTLISEREFVGTWTSIELKLAVEKGYKILFISEIWKYQTVKDDPRTGEEGIFTPYINAFLKIKQEASGWPSECTDDASKARYVEEYERVEGICMDPDKIEKNPGLRAVAKLCLNCLWGKFAQRDNLTQTSIIQSPEEWNKIVINPEVEMKSIIQINPTTLLLGWNNIHEAEIVSPKTNVAIAAFTTAHARKKLYSYLDEKQEKILYFDTDSVIYKSNGSANDRLKLGNFLGDLTDELACYGEGSYIKSFVSGGPKFYSYVIQKPDGGTVECCKMKGVRLDVENRKKINFESVQGLVENTQEPFRIEFNSIRRTKKHEVVTRKESKIIRATGPKRRFDTPTTTLPYGFKRQRT